MNKVSDTIKRLRGAAALSRALAERDAVRKAAPGNDLKDVAARLRAGHDVHMAARRLIEANRRKP